MKTRVESASKSPGSRHGGRVNRASAGAPGRWTRPVLWSGARLLVLVALPTVLLAFSARTNLLGLGLLVVCKVSAMVAMTAGRGRRGETQLPQRIVLIEAITLGVLVAFVASLALGKLAEVPRSILLFDWLATIGLVVVVRRDAATSRREKVVVGVSPGIESDPLSEVVAAICGQVVMLCLPPGKGGNELIDQVEALEPSGWMISGGDPSRIARLGPCVIRLEEETRPLRELFATFRPDVVIQVLDPRFEEEASRANTTRSLVNEALRVEVQSFVLVTTEDGRGAVSRLSERILGALARLTRSRLVRVRLAADVEGTAAARRILRIAAKGRDGTIVSLGKTGGSCVDKPGDAGHVEELWAELDRIRA